MGGRYDYLAIRQVALLAKRIDVFFTEQSYRPRIKTLLQVAQNNRLSVHRRPCHYDSEDVAAIVIEC